jgi:hypothetical protein
MYTRSTRLCASWSVVAFFALFHASGVRAQQATDGADRHDHADRTSQDHDTAHDHARHDGPPMFAARDGSGTSWLPDATPMYALHRGAGAWQLMAHGHGYVQYIEDSGSRGARQFGSINWFMGMARREIRGGRFGARAMVSLEPWTIRGCGYPDLLATGESCGGNTIHDRQHPHDLVMELAAEYDHHLRGSLRWQVYGGLAGEPALGPVAFPHRLSAASNPLAPIGHHWLDATHITFGVVTAGVHTGKWKAEASAFNGREPDENRRDLDLAALDSFAGRIWFLPTPTLAFQVSGGRLKEAEVDRHTGLAVDVDRLTASVTYHRPVAAGLWASTVAWGRNSEHDDATGALLIETSVTRQDTDNWFGRWEIGRKLADDLAVHSAADSVRLVKLQVGYARYGRGRRALQPGIGASVSASVVPRALESAYGRRVSPGFTVFLTVRPTRHAM